MPSNTVKLEGMAFRNTVFVLVVAMSLLVSLSYGTPPTVIHRRSSACADGFKVLPEIEIAPAPVAPSAASPAGPPRLSDLARTQLESRGYRILDDAFASGGQATLAKVSYEGRIFLIKEARTKAKNGSSKTPDLPIIFLMEEGWNVPVVARQAEIEHKPPYFLVPEQLDLTDDRLHPILKIPFFPRKPGSPEAAPSLQWRMEHGFEGMKSLADRMKIYNQLLDAIAICHRAEIIHRDLKPENILIDDEGNVRIIDFGLAAPINSFPGGNQPGRISGTFEFMSDNALMGGAAKFVDDLTAVRKIGWLLINGNQSLEGKTFTRPLNENAQIVDYATAPTNKRASEAMAVAAWTRLSHDAGEHQTIFKNAQEMPPARFFEDYGKRLAVVEKEDSQRKSKTGTAAYDLLGSMRLIKEFPEGLHLADKSSKEVRDGIILGVFQLREQTRDGKDHLTGPHPHLLFEAFFARLRELQQKRLAEPDSYYLARVKKVNDAPNQTDTQTDSDLGKQTTKISD